MIVKPDTFVYRMTKEKARALLNARTKAERKIPNDKYLCEMVNTQNNLKGECVKVVIV